MADEDEEDEEQPGLDTQDPRLEHVHVTNPNDPTFKAVQRVKLKHTSRQYKAAVILNFGRPNDPEVRHQELHIYTYGRDDDGPGFDYDNPLYHWKGRDEAIDRLLTFLSTRRLTREPGTHRLIPVPEEVGDLVGGLVEAVQDGQIADHHLTTLLGSLSEHPQLLSELGQAGYDDYRRIVAAALHHGQRKEAIHDLVTGIEEGQPESFFQELFDENWWMLGSRYIDRVDRDRYSPDDIIDVTLVRGDGFAELVELKRPDANLFVDDGGRLTPSSEVHRAVYQCSHYLAKLEQLRDHIRGEYQIDTLRVRGRVLIGYIDDEGADDEREALRKYNGNLHGIEVVTYDQILRQARNLVNLDGRIAGLE
jgi:hypothetical protein